MDKITFISAQHVKIQFELASVIQRCLAYVIDTLINYLYAMIVVIAMIDSFFGNEDFFLGIFVLLFNLPLVFYKPVMEYYFNGQTLGKMAMGLRMVRINGDRLTIRDIFVRWVMRGDFFWIALLSNPSFIGLIPFLSFMGFIMVCMTPLKQRFGDMIVSVIAVRSKSSRTYTLEEVLKKQAPENYAPVYSKCISFTDEDMMFIKKAIEQYKKYPVGEVKEILNKITQKTKERLEITEPVKDQIGFLERVLKDYVYLTR